MKNFLFLACLLFTFSVNAQAPQVTESDLIGCWTDSKEEGTNELSIYRPCTNNNDTIDLYRFSFQLKENGQCTYHSAVAKSSNKMINGTWTYDTEKVTLHIFNEDGRQVTQLTIKEYASGLLKFSKEY
ncbi:MAG: hypothetical protein ACI9SJ_002141 [Flavobacteriaceae bacterium]|jgi:hypothetical protein|uniref:hypothetical protein n=1 Tax=Candidatus Marifrigoribacter sp. Uisw_064 TaxID=3230970 RepID=UPI003ADE86C2